MELDEVMRTTPATRIFAEDAVHDAVLHRVLDNARFAPSGGNRQGWRVVVIRDADTRARIRDLYRLGWQVYLTHSRGGNVPFAPGSDGRPHPPADGASTTAPVHAPDQFADHLDQVPVLLIVGVDLRALAVTDNDLDRQSIVGGASVYPFTHNLLLAARNEGLGGVMTTVICRQEPAVKELLGFPEWMAVAGLVALGVPAKVITRLRRRPVAEFTTVDRLDGPAFSG